ncbi:dihydrofolate reductase family protein [Streptomyces sp. SID13031]|uniref:dihydrofolate reductase family protein n=1 Tax=Streptomyces sp. SID13031 TaxID=2706046 RepID=UPI0013C783A8|nr:dihydrofolate reductase family protein [Streptomyces sp. SID13031]NEA32970.1 dihydrofolate reductase [Streptomyces sp. SID13031]
MAKVRVHNFSITLDGFATGLNQRLDAPFGDGMEGLHDWMFAAMEDGATGLDAERAARWNDNIGATIMGRNMFGPQRGPWEDESWTGWWGPNPPYHHDTFVHTHHLRPDLPMEGGTTFHFTDDPVEKVHQQALEAAAGQDIVVGGGPTTVQRYLRAGLIDELNLAIVPLLAGAGLRLFDNLGDTLAQYRITEHLSSPAVTHVQLTRR